VDLLAGVLRVIWGNPAELLCYNNSLQQSRLAVPRPVLLAIPMPAGSVYILTLWLVCTTHSEKLSVCIVNEIDTKCTIVSISRSWQSQFKPQASSIFTLNMLRQTIRFLGQTGCSTRFERLHFEKHCKHCKQVLPSIVVISVRRHAQNTDNVFFRQTAWNTWESRKRKTRANLIR
jgi:hypothetical protein